MIEHRFFLPRGSQNICLLYLRGYQNRGNVPVTPFFNPEIERTLTQAWKLVQRNSAVMFGKSLLGNGYAILSPFLEWMVFVDGPGVGPRLEAPADRWYRFLYRKRSQEFAIRTRVNGRTRDKICEHSPQKFMLIHYVNVLLLVNESFTVISITIITITILLRVNRREEKIIFRAGDQSAKEISADRRD